MVVLTTLFFMWGFMTVMNDVLVPHWKAVFHLTYSEGLLVQACFFTAYFVGSLAYFIASSNGNDPIQRIGYKRAAIMGLCLSAVACGLFIPASYAHSYPAFLCALFVLGLGFTVLQIAANPFVAIIGAPEGASSRLNLAQAFNSLGTTLAPLVGGYLIFERLHGDAVIRYPYVVYAAVFALLAVWIAFTRLPEPPHVAHSGGHALRHPQLRWGMVAIFCYVGAEVAIGSLLINYLGTAGVMALPERVAKHYLSLYWGGAMTGRFLGAIALSRTLPWTRRFGLLVLIGAAMFGLLYWINSVDGRFDVQALWPMAVLIAGNLAAFVLAGPHPSRALGLFALAAMALLVVSVGTHGPWAMWAIVAIGLFNSIMWSNIFTLAIDGLKADTSQGSSLLVMMIVGGAAVPALQGLIADALATQADPNAGLQVSFLLPALCYAFLAWYGFRGSKHTPPA